MSEREVYRRYPLVAPRSTSFIIQYSVTLMAMFAGLGLTTAWIIGPS